MKTLKYFIILVLTSTILVANSQSLDNLPAVSQLEKSRWELTLANGGIIYAQTFNKTDRTFVLTYKGESEPSVLANGDQMMRISRYYLSNSIETTKFRPELVGKSSNGRYMIVEVTAPKYKGTASSPDKNREDEAKFKRRMENTPENKRFEVFYIEYLTNDKLAVRPVNPVTQQKARDLYVYTAIPK